MNVAVVGAGLAGLTAAWRLQAAGHRVTVYEAGPKPGGRMATAHVGGFAFDTGANLLIEHYAHLRALADEVGIGDQWFAFESGAGGILEEGGLSPSPDSVRELMRHPGLSFGSRLRLVAVALEAWRRGDDLDFFDLSVGDDALDGVDAWTDTAERCGEDVARHLVDPFVRTFHFHSARLLSMKYLEALLAQLLRGRFVTHGFRGYMEALPLALGARLSLRIASPVRRVARVGRGIEVGTVVGSEVYEHVVLATTAPVARAMLVDPPAPHAALLDAARYSSTLMCSYRVPLAAAGDFEGIWVPVEESALIACCANETCKGSADAGTCVLTMGLHDEAGRELLELSDEHVLGLVAREWERLYPRCRDSLAGLHVQRWREALPVYGVGTVARVRRFWEHGQGEGGLWLAGDHLNHPWLEGAVRCGEKVAERVDGVGR